MEKWEYKVVGVFSPGFKPAEKMEQQLNELGEAGWELIEIDFKINAFILKRRKRV